VRPTQPVEIFVDMQKNFMEIVPEEPLRRERGVAKYSDFRPIEGYISETVQDTR